MWFDQQVLIWRVLRPKAVCKVDVSSVSVSIYTYTTRVVYQHVLIERVLRPKAMCKVDVSSVSVSTYMHYMCGLSTCADIACSSRLCVSKADAFKR